MRVYFKRSGDLVFLVFVYSFELLNLVGRDIAHTKTKILLIISKLFYCRKSERPHQAGLLGNY